VVVATPHYSHTPISVDFMSRGVNVLVEKPIAVHVKDAQKMIDAYEAAKKVHPKLVFEAMFMMRTFGCWQKIREMVTKGELGRLVRATWIITEWFRSQTYYDNGGWRATWEGEGGGVLLNQCPHNLDLWQWFFGLPQRITGFAAIGKYHNIEVEDEVTGLFEYANGMVGHFVTTTAEAPGTNRLEIIGENGKLTFEKGRLAYFRNQSSMLDFIKTSPGMWDVVDGKEEEVPYTNHGESGHRIVLDNFAEAILHGAPLIAPAPEGINSLSLSNGIMLSSFKGKPVDLPLDAEDYAARLRKLARTSRFQKTVTEPKVADDMTKSFH